MNFISNRLRRAVGAKQSLESATSAALEPTVCFGNVPVRVYRPKIDLGRVTQRRRKFAFLSAIALTLIFAVTAVPSKANGTAEGGTLTIALQNFPDTVARGDKLTGTISIALAPSKPQSRTQVQFQLFASTPLGDALVQSGSFTVRTGTTHTVNIDQQVPEDIAPGKYSITLVVVANGESLTVSHEFEVV